MMRTIQTKLQLDDLEAFKSTIVYKNMNCYSYALNIFDEEIKFYIGCFSNYKNDLIVDDTKLVYRFIKDMIKLGKDPKISSLEEDIEEDRYKIALFSNYGYRTNSFLSDFHLVRQNENGSWSHKLINSYPEIIDPNQFNTLRISWSVYHLIGIFSVKKG